MRKKCGFQEKLSFSSFPKSKKNVCYQLYGAGKKDPLLLILITHKLCEIQIAKEYPIGLTCCLVLGRIRFTEACEHTEVETTSALLSQLPGSFL